MNSPRATTEKTRPDAVVWVDEQHAIIARREPEGISTVEIRRLSRPANRFLAQVVHEIAGRGPVMLIGSAPIRLELERRYVAVSHRPDRIVAPPRAATADIQVARGLDRLAA